MAGFSSPHIGRLFGIDVELHWSFILLLIVILLLSFYYFILWALLFVFVLMHELVHSVTSIRNGVRVKKIILYPFGGGSVIDFEHVTPALEFRISIVGPLASLLIAALLGMVTVIAPPGIIRGTLQTLFLLNVFLGIFNLLPWLPLDGGRALRGYLQKSRSFLDSTRIAVKVGNGVTFAFIAGTIVYVALLNAPFAYKEFIVLWDVVIAMFVYNGAQAELQSAIIRSGIEGLRVSDAMSRNYVLVPGTVTLHRLYRAVLSSHKHIALFKRGSRIMMLSSITLSGAAGKPGIGLAQNARELPPIEYGAPLYGAVERMRSEEAGVLAVMRSGRLAGIVTAQHVEAIIALHMSHLRRYKNKPRR